MKEFIHPELNRQITAIGGRYILVKEERLACDDEELLYLTGVAVFDTTCCGAGGCAYAMVPGFVRKWKYKKTDDGSPVTLVEPVADDRLRDKIRQMIISKETVYQVDFL